MLIFSATEEELRDLDRNKNGSSDFWYSLEKTKGLCSQLDTLSNSFNLNNKILNFKIKTKHAKGESLSVLARRQVKAHH